MLEVNIINGCYKSYKSIVSNFFFCIELFLVSPGDGNEFIYSPLEVNVTFYCVVNNTQLEWMVDRLVFSGLSGKLILESRRIFQSGPVTSSVGVTTSNLTMFGLLVNNKSRICCNSLMENELQKNCTTLIVYGKNSCYYRRMSDS